MEKTSFCLSLKLCQFQSVFEIILIFAFMAIRLRTYEHVSEVPDLPGKNLFHSVELFHILEQTPGFRPLMVVAFEGSVPVGRLLCAARSIFSITDFFQKVVVYGNGEYFNTTRRSDEIFAEILSYLTTRFGDQVTFIEFRNIDEPLYAYRYFRTNGYFPIRWLRVQNSIHQNPVDKWMSASRKKHIQQALKYGAVLDTLKSEEDLQQFFKMLKHYYSSKISRYLPEFYFFHNLLEFKSEKEMGEIFTVKYKGKIIGGALCLFSDETAYLMVTGGLRKRYPMLHPNTLAVWNAMVYAHEKGYRHFEFFNAGLPFKKFGYRDFILRFGGKQFGTRRWYHVRWNWLNRLLIKFYV